ncbi:neuromedin-B isoform X4 [Cuculus canorus]|uniref:neuromedin-B isoform X4 n=1 Tax=Cuculus canorus TaxID=55661 RepID=UPI0023AAFFF2|nr:neuromedin-B isoform X4 [Cuculus canorus]
MWALRCLVLLLCGAALGPAVHLDFAEHRSQAAKIKVNPRGNLWATGHFMGKKSVTGSPHLEPPEEPAVPTAFGPSLRALLEEMVELLTRELLRVLWRERLLDENQGKYDLTDQTQRPWCGFYLQADWKTCPWEQCPHGSSRRVWRWNCSVHGALFHWRLSPSLVPASSNRERQGAEILEGGSYMCRPTGLLCSRHLHTSKASPVTRV